MKGKLPWQGICTRGDEERHKQILQYKRLIPIKMLCEDLPQIIGAYIRYCRSLEFTDKPDYKGLKKQLTEHFNQSLDGKEFIFDWFLKAKLNKEPLRTTSSNSVAVRNEEKKEAAPPNIKNLSSNFIHFSLSEIKRLQITKLRKLGVPRSSVGSHLSGEKGTNCPEMDSREVEDKKEGPRKASDTGTL
eukprot:TRINITY_DN10814_c0_g1_i3.p2 TRINITY_DN10814_c0_g1~~TRINITY_DN10814_c0_g1_i3.p2  ORF type:complete len:188 (-),score=32.49 TRINITY_DN10814_c0_g1_i3:441-1004(-)